MATKDDQRAPGVDTDPSTPASRDRHLETQPGVPAPLADETLGKLAGPLPDYDFVQPNSDGLDNAHYEASARVPPAPQQIDEPKAPVVVARPDESTHDSRRKTEGRRRVFMGLVAVVLVLAALVIVRSLVTPTETPSTTPSASMTQTATPTASFVPTVTTATTPPPASVTPPPTATASARPSATSPVAPIPSTTATAATPHPSASSYIDKP